MTDNLLNFGIGIDIADTDKFEKLPYSENMDFYNKIFSISEIKYCMKFKYPSSHFAGKFALKEAVKKSISLSIPMKDIVTSHSNSKPKIILTNKKKFIFVCSLSHEKNMAIAVVISQKID